MSYTKATIAAVTLFALSQTAVAAGNFQSNETADILVGGLAIETGTHSGPVLNGTSTVYAKNASSYENGLCVFNTNYLIHNDSSVKVGTFLTRMTYNGKLGNNSYTILPATNIKNFAWPVKLKPGKNVIKVHADHQNAILENNEINNHLTKTVTVVGQCRPLTKKPAVKQFKSSDTRSQAKDDCKYDPNSARLCGDVKRKKMKIIDPFK